ncbi:hypothetical protein D1BOALGB6SA_3499 [Olavius sp. associated proteobacterium Delta 1]|nr:hypothetical protein D1BOALGB6SA_3499 [Olavius sp. associated proteobacterium Delta 1]
MNYPTPNEAALPHIDKKALSNPVIYPTLEMMENIEFLTDLGKDNSLYDEIWTRIKSH